MGGSVTVVTVDTEEGDEVLGRELAMGAVADILELIPALTERVKEVKG